MLASKAQTGEKQKRRGRERPRKSENRANDFIACWETDRIFYTNGLSEEELSAQTYSRSLLLKASESQLQSHIAAKSRNKFLRKHLVGIKKRERFTFS